MNVFDLRRALLSDYRKYVESFIKIQDSQVKAFVQERLDKGALWPNPLVQLNPTFEAGTSLGELVQEGVLHPENLRIFRLKDRPTQPILSLHKHQEQAIRCAQRRENYVVTTGTGSGKSLAYIIPIVDYVLRQGTGRGIQAIVVYPMNALANSQKGELEKFINKGYPNERGPVRFARYTGQEKEEERREIQQNPPDILLTNYMMLDLILTRPRDSSLIEAAQGLKFLVLDELHTYRGRQGADVAFLVRRLRERLRAEEVICIGTSATMASSGGRQERQSTVAAVASRIFGLEVHPHNVIGETLRRTTTPLELQDPAVIAALKQRVLSGSSPTSFSDFVQDPLASWVESRLGLKEEEGHLERQNPAPLSGPQGLALELAALLSLEEQPCLEALQECLLAGYQITNPHTGLKAFAFRLHQFISRGDTVYASLEPPPKRHLTLQAQQYVPNSREKVLLPLAFCRECGQEYYTVWRRSDQEGEHFEPRRVSERYSELGGEAGFLYPGEWPTDLEAIKERLPEDYLEQDPTGQSQIKREKREKLPKAITVASDGRIGTGGDMHYLAAPFEFCLCCSVGYGARQASDFGKLTTLGTEGRSTATTVLSLSAVTHLGEADIPAEARKLLSFTDNRQDASLQSGHFNDFVQTSLLRSAVYRAVHQAGEAGLSHDQLAQKVFEALGLAFHEYASNPQAKFAAKQNTDQALRYVLGYRIYRDLLRGWRITAPNLEQVGLLSFEYLSLEELCSTQGEWESFHPAIAGATPQQRSKVAKVLLDYLRKELAIKVDYLDRTFQERMVQNSNSLLSGDWALEENEKLEYARIAYAKPLGRGGSREGVYVSPRGSFGQYLRRNSTFPHHAKLSTTDLERIIKELFEALSVAGLVEKVDNEGYMVVAASFIWKEGDGHPPTEPLRTRIREGALREANPFFKDFYQTTALNLGGVWAAEHTAQVPTEEREDREEHFRRGELPVLYCSPTMELGVDISTLNVVNMRNVPPTPANYAQRSGRAGRSGSPALVFTYAATGNSHDQYFFRRPHEMVSGRVKPPRLDLSNEELIRTHLQAVWLAETGADLGRSLVDLLQVEGDAPSLEVKESYQADFQRPGAASKALARAQRILADLQPELQRAPWYTEDWPKSVMDKAPARLIEATDRWKSLFTAAREQAALHGRLILDAIRSQQEKEQSKRLRAEAEAQLRLLTDTSELAQSDFYSYRYFASEGFLPGYSFPRLPLSAYIPARRGGHYKDDFLSRPRFLAITEFGPFSTLYYEGAKYVAHKVILPPGSEQELRTLSIKRCDTCGYLHPVDGAGGPDLCQRCEAELPRPRQNLLRMQNVSTVRRDRINSDEEERQRLGYEVLSGVSFPPHLGRPSYQMAQVDGGALAEMTFSQAASIWRMNLGWLQRKNRHEEGFMLDPERGYWAKRGQDPDEIDDQNPTSRRLVQVIPFVEDRKNTLLFKPGQDLDLVQFASLLAALKSAIQVSFQLEETELAAELLPDDKTPRELLFYEAAEGGAGVLRQLVQDPQALPRVARTALNLCHFDEQGGEPPELQPAEGCEAACYDCLMNYANQRFHRLLDRKAIRDILLELASSQVQSSSGEQNRQQHLQALLRQCDSELERSFLQMLELRSLRLPSHAQHLIPEAQTRVDFYYQEARTVIYIDGPHHLYPERQQRDQQQERSLRLNGYSVLRLAASEEWERILQDRRDLFGGPA